MENSLDIADREESAKVIALIDDEQLVNADMLREEAVRPPDRVGADLPCRIVWTCSRGVIASATRIAA
jgi:hypothetical protein